MTQTPGPAATGRTRLRTRLRTLAAVALALAAAVAATTGAAPATAGPAHEQLADTTPPVIDIAIPESPGQGVWRGWYADPVTARISATDDSGVASFSYRLTGGHHDTGDAPPSGHSLTISTQGVTTMALRAVDTAGNVTEREYGIGIDRVDPGVHARGSLADQGPFHRGEQRTLIYDCTDFGTAVTSCTADYNGTPIASGDTVTLAQEGPLRFTFRTQDAVGRVGGATFQRTVLPPLLGVAAVPGISGASSKGVRVGDELTASGASFSPTATPFYHWVVGGQVRHQGPTFRPGADLVGERISVYALGVRDGYSHTPTPLVGSVLVIPGAFAVTGRPTVSGAVHEGSTLEVTAPASVSPRPDSVRNLWTVGGTVIETGTPRITLTAAQVGRRISCTTTYALDGYETTAVPCRFAGGTTSAVVAGNAWTVRAPARLAGKARVGGRLRAVAPVLSGRADRYSYQWLRNGRVVKGATRAVFRPRAADARARISVRVTAITAHRPATVSTSRAHRVTRR
ncbi:hypothetical protein [Pimelobacter simplex]|uniref:hypothetical protein n=1 Tax=Nocardioides simplex TaxID=2045 RepID=UPI003AB019F2